MAAMRKAMSFPFVKWIELDVQLSSDGVPVVIHDDTLRRTTGRKGRVADYTAAELNRTDAGAWFSPAFKGETIPLLEQVMEAAAGKCKLNIELKTYGGRYPGIEKAVLGLVSAHGLQRETVITSFDAAALMKVKELAPEVQTGLIIDGAPPDLAERVIRLGASFLSIGYSHVNRLRLDRYRAAGLQVMAWTVNDPAAMRRLTELGPDLMICTNFPDRYETALTGKPQAGWISRLFRNKTAE